eukprot:171234-Pelagomonas_calceolata.AAC.4
MYGQIPKKQPVKNPGKSQSRGAAKCLPFSFILSQGLESIAFSCKLRHFLRQQVLQEEGRQPTWHTMRNKLQGTTSEIAP